MAEADKVADGRVLSQEISRTPIWRWLFLWLTGTTARRGEPLLCMPRLENLTPVGRVPSRKIGAVSQSAGRRRGNSAKSQSVAPNKP